MRHSEQSPGSRQDRWQVRGNSSRILVGGTLDYQAIEWRRAMEGMYFSRSGNDPGGAEWVRGEM